MTDFPLVNEKHICMSLLPAYCPFHQRLIAGNGTVVLSSTKDHFLQSSICVFSSRVCFQSQKLLGGGKQRASLGKRGPFPKSSYKTTCQSKLRAEWKNSQQNSGDKAPNNALMGNGGKWGSAFTS